MGPRGPAGPSGKNGEDVSGLHQLVFRFSAESFMFQSCHGSLLSPIRVRLEKLVELVSVDLPEHR